MANLWRMKGDYFKTCSCAFGCPCDFWAPPTEGLCEGLLAMRINEGHFEKVPLSGLIWAVSFHWPAALHLGNGTIQPYVEERATSEQRNALLTILSGQAGGSWFQVVASLVSKVLEPKFVPISLEFNLEKREGKCKVGSDAEVVTEPIRDLNGKDVRIRIDMPGGIEYFTAEVAAAKVMESKGPIKFKRSNVHSSFSAVDHTPAGLMK